MKLSNIESRKFDFGLFQHMLLIILLPMLAACSKADTDVSNVTNMHSASIGISSNKSSNNTNVNNLSEGEIHLDVYKSADCSCCSKWISHIEDKGINVTAINEKTMYPIKEKYRIEGKHQSCHTGISSEGYIIEGHIPAKYIRQFLAEKPKNAIGITVPAMPLGTPGMEVGDNFMPYQILLLKEDGSTDVYAEVKNYQQQF